MTNENKELCKKCGGKCCQKMPGIAIPADWRYNREKIKKSIESGMWSIDWYIAEPDIYYLRPRIKGKPLVHGAWGSSGSFCVFWRKKDGCVLPFERRPYQCRELVPVEGVCVGEHDKLWHAKKWIKYQNLLKEYVKEEDREEEVDPIWGMLFLELR